MSKPSDIPQDIWDAAKAVLAQLDGTTPDRVGGQVGSLSIVARAILAERERCAKVCEAAAEQFLSPEYATGQPMSSFGERFACETCAEGIRSGV